MGARLGEALGDAGINIESLCGLGWEGRGIVHVLVEDAATARHVLADAGIEVESEADPIVADMSTQADTPGSLGKAARAVADAGVNVRAIYLGTNNRGVIVTSDKERARRALGM